MSAPVIRRPPIIRALGLSLTLSAVAIGLLAAVEVGVPLASGSLQPWEALQLPGVALVFLLTGTIAWWRRPGNRTGALMMCGAVVPLIADLGVFDVPWLGAIGTVTATVMLAVLVHLLLAFPSGRLRTTAERWIVAATYGVSLVLQAPLYLFDPAASPGGMLAVARVPTAVTAGMYLQRGCGIAVMIAAAVILGGRFRRAGARERRVLGPLYVYGIAAVIAVPVIPSVLRPLTGMPAPVMSLLQVAVISLVPVAIGCAMLLGGFARTVEVQELGTWLEPDAGGRMSLRDALSHALGDPSVQLAFWVPETRRYVDDQGRPVVVPGAGTGRGSVQVRTDGRPVAAIGYDASLIADDELVASAGRVVALALDRERLTAELHASRRELRASRVRIVQAGDEERRRIAQDLHDGLQADLVLLGVQAQDVGDIPGATPEVVDAATDLRIRIDRAARGLRQLVHSVMPPPLTQGGLASAVEDLVDRMPVPTRLDLGDLDGTGGTGGVGSDRAAAKVIGGEVAVARLAGPGVAGPGLVGPGVAVADRPGASSPLSGEIQSTAYFIVAEGLANAVKHANADKIDVRLALRDGKLTVRVADDGAGGASVSERGRGLGGLMDRVAALGGTLTVDSPVGGGTVLVAELPCAC